MRKIGKKRFACSKGHCVCNKKVAHKCRCCKHFVGTESARERRRRSRRLVKNELKMLCREGVVYIIEEWLIKPVEADSLYNKKFRRNRGLSVPKRSVPGGAVKRRNCLAMAQG